MHLEQKEKEKEIPEIKCVITVQPNEEPIVMMK